MRVTNGDGKVINMGAILLNQHIRATIGTQGGKVQLFKSYMEFESYPTAVHFVWRLSLNSVATRDNLRHSSVPIPLFAVMCGLEDESVSHLFFECKSAEEVWNLCNKWTGISSVAHNQVENNFYHFGFW